MNSTLLWLLAAGPLSLAVIGMIPSEKANRRPKTISRLARAAASLCLAIALISLTAVMAQGSLRTGTTSFKGAGLALYLDALSAVMFCLVSFIGLIVIIYSRNYMDGDPAQGRFFKLLCCTLAAVVLLIVSGNLFQFLIAWIATSFSLHRLLIFYPERPAALLAVRKKFIVSRAGDLCLIAAMVLLYRAFGTLDYVELFTAVKAMDAGGMAIPGAIHKASLLLVFAALLKSAQFPVHGWLIEVMETPTPVSALLHAGIINSGGFLVLRFADIVSLSTPSLDALAIIGGITALFGSVVMLTQTSVKVSLAYSTIAQMGFMMLECGLGAFSAATLHIVAHSLYKAHAFLSSGSIVDIARASWSASPGSRPHPTRLIMVILALLVVTIAVGYLFGATMAAKPGVFALGAVTLFGLIHLIANSIDESPNIFVIGRTIGLSIVVALAYFSLQYSAEVTLAGALPATLTLRGPFDLAIVTAIVLLFGLVTLFQSLLPHQAGKPRWQALYAPIANGFYVNTLANRWILRFWPKRGEASSTSPYPSTQGTGLSR